jgi:hypothetical protein
MAKKSWQVKLKMIFFLHHKMYWLFTILNHFGEKHISTRSIVIINFIMNLHLIPATEGVGQHPGMVGQHHRNLHETFNLKALVL